jgi:hypothetical protein
MGMDTMAWLWSLLGFFSLVRGFLPQELTEMLEKWWNALLRPANPYAHFHIPDDGISGVTNDLYRVVQLYLIAANLCSAADELILSRDENEEGITYSLAGRRNTSLFPPQFFTILFRANHVTTSSLNKFGKLFVVNLCTIENRPWHVYSHGSAGKSEFSDRPLCRFWV